MPQLTLTLDSLVYGGQAMGRLPDGRAVFVPFALPGEQVRLRPVEEKRGHVRAELLEVLQPSASRISPRCAHFGLCGGCHYQHMPYADQLAAKSAILREQLQRLGGLSDPPLAPAVPAPEDFYYRNHVQFHLAPDGKLGYHREGSAEVFPIQECHLPEPPLDAIWKQMEIEAIPGLERIGLRLGSGDDIQLILDGSDPRPPELSVEDLPISVAYLSPAGRLVLAGSEAVYIEVLGRVFRLSAGSFFQVNTRMAETMVEHLLGELPARLNPDRGVTLLDAYCGVGLFSAFLAPLVGRLVGIEALPFAGDDFAVNLDEFDNVELYQASVEDVLPALEIKPQIALVDPPRAGLSRLALDGILRLQPSLLVYISCDPATLARDAKRLVSAGYSLKKITPFDLFPQTYHIESITFWEK